MNEGYTTIAVSHLTRDTINELRGKYTVNEYLEGVIYYLRTFRIDPMRRDISPNQDVLRQGDKILKRLEDVVKIIRSFEKGTKEQLEGLEGSGQGSDALAAENRQLKATISVLRKEIQEGSSNKTSARLMKLRELVAELVQESVSGDGSLFVGPARVNEFMESVKDVMNG